MQAFQAFQFNSPLIDTAEVENVIDYLPLEALYVLNFVFEEGKGVQSGWYVTTA